jgi:uncharacterized damage-inducible protein DinB
MSPAHLAAAGVAHSSSTAAALRAQLECLREVIAPLPPRLFRIVPSAVSGSIGAHVRHCLDHVRALTSIHGSEELSYDSRLRGTAVETDPAAAVSEIDRLCAELDGLPAEWLDDSLRLRSLMHADGGYISVGTTAARELAFVVQHTIHHAAGIAILLEQLGVSVPPEFGYAPSTPRRH